MLHVFFIALLSTLSLFASTTENVYHQILPLLTKNINPEQLKESDQQLLNGACACMAHGTNHSKVNQELIQAISSVDFFCDILPAYFKTNTTSGRIQTALITAQMTDDIATLKHRQALIQYFYEHSEIRESLQKVLSQATQAENRFYALYQSANPETSQAQKQATQRLYCISDSFKKFNNNPHVLGFFKRAKLLNVSLVFILPILHSIKPIMDTQNLSCTDALKFAIKNCPRAFEELTKLWKMSNTTQKSLIVTGITAYTAYIGWIAYIIISDIKIDFDLIHDKQKSLIETAKLIHSLKEMTTLLQKNLALQSLLPTQYQKLHELFDTQSTVTSSALKDLIECLGSSSFQGSDSYFLSKQGKILATHHKLCEHKGELVPYLEALGQIDAYLAAAQSYQQYQNHPKITFCLPQFVESTTPVLYAQEFWHPLINHDFVITNSLKMDNNIKNLMITGPNAGGKTTSLMSLIINIIFAQSFGIAPSKSLIFTPFAKIHSYLDITTNLQEGLSLFAAEVDRAKKLKQSILSCTPDQKTFTIIDEIFSGTNPQVASDVGFKFAAQLGEMAHSITIITTHFPRLTDIEQEIGTFINYKVADATIMPNGKIVYPFKLVPGISNQNIAKHMLEHEGII